MSERPRPPTDGEPFSPLAAGPRLWNAIEAAPDLADLDKRLWRLLARLARDGTWCRATVTWLARSLGRSRRAVLYALRRLSQRGLIVRQGRGCRGTAYRFVWGPSYQRLQQVNRRIASEVRRFAEDPTLEFQQVNPGIVQELAPFATNRPLEFQQLNPGIVQELAPFEDAEPGMVQVLHPNSARACTQIVQELAHIQGIQGLQGTVHQQQQRNETASPAVAAAGPATETARRLLAELLPDLLPREREELLGNHAAEKVVALALWSRERHKAGQVKNAAGLLLTEARRNTQPPEAYLAQAHAMLESGPAHPQAAKARPADGDSLARPEEAAELWEAKLPELIEFVSPRLEPHLRRMRPLGFAPDGALVLVGPQACCDTVQAFALADISETLGLAVRLVARKPDRVEVAQ